MLFCNLLDFAVLNAYVLHEKLKFDTATVGKSRLFLKTLGKGLCHKLHNQRRRSATHPGLDKHDTDLISLEVLECHLLIVLCQDQDELQNVGADCVAYDRDLSPMS